jgi:hypothetical protein
MFGTRTKHNTTVDFQRTDFLKPSQIGRAFLLFGAYFCSTLQTKSPSMRDSTKQKGIVQHLSPKVRRIARQIVPFDEFLQFAHALLEEICQKTISLHPDLPPRKIRDIVFEDTVFALANAAHGLLAVLQSGKADGRVKLSANGESFLVDLRSEFPKE